MEQPKENVLEILTRDGGAAGEAPALVTKAMYGEISVMNVYQQQTATKRLHPPCLWEQAGVVGRKTCREDFNCAGCRFDKAMQAVAEENRRLNAAGRPVPGKRANIVFWKEKMKEQPSGKKPCLHHMKGRIGFRSCTNNYRCGDCEFDQYFQDQYTVHTVVRPVAFLDIDGFQVPQGYYLHSGHAWVKIEEGHEVRVGLDDFALRLLGPFSGSSIPLVGKAVCQGRPGVRLFRDMREARLLSPVSGVVTAVNSELLESATKANMDPYTGGWLMCVHAGRLREDLKNLMIGDEAGAFIGSEVEQLYQVIEEEAGPLAADGGRLGENIYGHLPEKSWGRLTRRFLRS